MVEPDTLAARIRAAIPDAEHVSVEDLTGTKDHFQATVVAASFAGKTRVEQHQMVYRALGDLMAGPVHALALATHTPEAWRKRAGLAT
jgi:stress-induced morphogen